MIYVYIRIDASYYGCREMQIEESERMEKERDIAVHVPLTDEKEIDNMVLEKKKMELLRGGAQRLRSCLIFSRRDNDNGMLKLHNTFF